jgi:hypothetical protein
MLVAWLLGCTQTYTGVDEACPESVRGESFGTDGAVEFFTRGSCYRRLAGLPSFEITEAAETATVRHVTYMVVNQQTTSTEDPTKSGYTGAEIWDRLADAGSTDVTSTNSLLWYGVVGPEFDPYPADPVARVDAWMAEPLVRQVFLQPSLRAAGYSYRDGYNEFVILADLPPSQHTNTPIVYPVDGQTDVPTSWTPVTDETSPVGEPVGYPITITVGDDGQLETDENPPDLRIISATLTGPEGEVTTRIWGAGNTAADLPYTAAILPYEPFAADADYTLTARVTWLETYEDVEVTFHTASAADDTDE